MKPSNDNCCRLNDVSDPEMEDDIEWLLENANTIAIVGLSPDPKRPSHQVALFLKEYGYKIIPVRPEQNKILGQKTYPNLTEIQEKIDIVCIFRRSEFVPPIVDEAIRIKILAIWMQEGIRNEFAAAKAREAGLKVIMDRCMSKEIYKRIKKG